MTDAPTLRRFLSKIKLDPDTGCWVWQAGTFRGGYGQFHVDSYPYPAHRLSFQWFVGAIPTGKYVLHSCDNPPCCNPLHLSIGDHAENMRQCIERGRKAKGERVAGAVLTADKVREIRKSDASQKHLAALYGVDQSTISLIKTFKTWRHVS